MGFYRVEVKVMRTEGPGPELDKCSGIDNAYTWSGPTELLETTETDLLEIVQDRLRELLRSKRAQPRGGWVCSDIYCYAINEDAATKCRTCGKLRNRSEVKAETIDDLFWICRWDNCGQRNGQSSRTCTKCGKDRFQPIKLTVDWICVNPKCGHRNIANPDICSGCGRAREYWVQRPSSLCQCDWCKGTRKIGVLGLIGSGAIWMCTRPLCLAMNPKSVTDCHVCGEARLNAEGGII